MQLADVLAFAMALGVAAFIPGPGITTLLARTLSAGKLVGVAVLVGMICGDLVYLSFAVFGLSLLVRNFTWLFLLIEYLATGYLFWLAWRFWHTKPERILVASQERRRDLVSGYMTGLLVTLANPKTITFYLSLVPLVLSLDQLTVYHWAFGLLPATVLVLTLVGGFYIMGAAWARHWLTSASSQVYIYRLAALAMAGAGVSLLLKAG